MVQENPSSNYGACFPDTTTLKVEATKIEYPIEFGKFEQINIKEDLGTNVSSMNNSPAIDQQFDESSQGFSSLEFDYEMLLNNANWYTADSVNSFEAYSDEPIENFWTQPFLYE